MSVWRRLGVVGLRLGYLAVLAAVFVVAAYVAFSLFVRRGVTPVPSVVGLSLDEASETLADTGLSLRHRDAEDRFADEVPEGRVLEQRPAGGTLAKRGGAVEVVLSLGQQRIEVPDVTGASTPAAGVTLAGAGLTVGAVARIVSAAGEPGAVAHQDPAAGSRVQRGAPVDLYVVADTLVDTYVMPDLVNRDYSDVRRFLEANGFVVGSVKFEPYEGLAERRVLRQYPLPGHPVRRRDVISLVVAAVPEPGEEGGA